MEHYINEALVVAVAFIVFIACLYKPIKLALLQFLDKRLLKAIQHIEDAEKMRKEAEFFLMESKHQFAEAKSTSLQIVENAKQKAIAILEEAEKKVENITKKKAELAINRISHHEKQIIEDFKNEAIELAIEYVQESIIKELDKTAQVSLIENSIASTKKLVH